jgi:hypothetical protein
MSAEPKPNEQVGKPTSFMRMIERQAQPQAKNQVVKVIKNKAQTRCEELAAIKKEAKWDLWFADNGKMVKGKKGEKGEKVKGKNERLPAYAARARARAAYEDEQ